MNWESDEELAADLAAAILTEQAVPERFVAAGKAAFAWRTVDAELAQLVADSAGQDALAGTRADHAEVRTVTFAAGDVTIDVEIAPDALLGQVVPAREGELEVVERDGATRTTAVDDVGWFTLRPGPAGTFRLRFRSPGRRDVLTAWITV